MKFLSIIKYIKNYITYIHSLNKSMTIILFECIEIEN